MERERDDRAIQLLGSLLVALLIVAATIAIVTAKFGATSAAEQEAVEQRQELQEERFEERQDLREERLKELGD